MFNKKGFSIIELSFVIVVTGILLLLAVPSFTGYNAKKEEKRVYSNIEALETLVNKRVIQNKSYLSEEDEANEVYLVNPNEIFLEEFKDKKGNPFSEDSFGKVYAVNINLGYIEEDDVYIYSEKSKKVYHKKGVKPNKTLEN